MTPPGPLWSNDINGSGIPTKQQEFGRPNSAILIDAGGTSWQTPIADGKFEENPMLLRTTQIQTLYHSGYTVFPTKDTQTIHTGKPLPVEKEEFNACDLRFAYVHWSHLDVSQFQGSVLVTKAFQVIRKQTLNLPQNSSESFGLIKFAVFHNNMRAPNSFLQGFPTSMSWCECNSHVKTS